MAANKININAQKDTVTVETDALANAVKVTQSDTTVNVNAPSDTITIDKATGANTITINTQNDITKLLSITEQNDTVTVTEPAQSKIVTVTTPGPPGPPLASATETDSAVTFNRDIKLDAGEHINLIEDQRIYFEADLQTWIEAHVSDAFRVVAGGNQMMIWDYDTGNRAVFGNGTKVYIGANNNALPSKELEVDGDIEIGGTISNVSTTNITASGNISSSGQLYGNILNAKTRVKAIGSSLEFSGNSLDLVDGDSLTFLLRASASNAVSLYYSGNKKLETTSKGVNITGNVTASGYISASATILAKDGDIANNLSVGGNLDITDTIYHKGDSNTKIRFPEVDTISFHTSGDEQIRIDASGNVTASGEISASGHLTSTGATFGGAGVGSTPYLFSNSSATSVGSDSLGFIIAAGSTTDQMVMKISGSAENASVGIGTPWLETLTKALTVNGEVSASGAVTASNLQINGAQIDFTNVPTSDPGVAGRVWRDGTDLKISTG